MPTAIMPRLVFRLPVRGGLVTEVHLRHGHRGAQQKAKQVLALAGQEGVPKGQVSYSFPG